MSVSWLQAACLLVLVAALCPGADGFSSQYLCGPHLVEALNMVCAEKGFYFNPQKDMHPVAHHSERRGIVQECCENPCSLLALEKYCN